MEKVSILPTKRDIIIAANENLNRQYLIAMELKQSAGNHEGAELDRKAANVAASGAKVMTESFNRNGGKVANKRGNNNRKEHKF